MRAASSPSTPDRRLPRRGGNRDRCPYSVRRTGSVPAARLAERLKIQGYDTTGLKAIYHVVDHFAGHTAQIIFATKLLTGQDLGYYAHLNKPKQAEATR